MHRLLVIHTNPEKHEKFEVVADSANPSVDVANPVSIQDAGGSEWAEFDDSTGYSSPYASIPCSGKVSGFGYWYVNKTGNVLNYDFAAARLSERKVITSGELHAEHAGRRFVARVGDSMVFLLDPQDLEHGAVRSFPVRFFGDHDCAAVYTEYMLS